MKACPTCGRLYPTNAGFCPEDGAGLLPASQAPLVGQGQDARLGTILSGRYEVRRVVADGGMGRVYEAIDRQRGTNVAVKILHPDIAQDEVAVERFKREFDVSRQISHGHIVAVHDFQPTTDGSYMLVMEFLSGSELRQVIDAEQTVVPARLIRIVAQSALGLDQAHGKRFVHRDLKPDNIFLVADDAGDRVKILDFGSVKDKTETAKKLTVMGTTIGSPFYMAPEQAQGLDTLDHRADVWALAAIVYECITGHVPFRGANGPSILLEILTKEPRPIAAEAVEGYPVPPAMAQVMAGAFKKSAAVRTATVGAFADALGHAYGLSGDHARWAAMSLAEVEAELTQTLPGAMAAAPQEQAPNAVDDFFGEADGLGVMTDPFAQGAPSPTGAPVAAPAAGAGYAVGSAPPRPQDLSAASAGDLEDAPAGVPKSGSGLLIALVAVVVAGSLAVAAALFFALR